MLKFKFYIYYTKKCWLDSVVTTALGSLPTGLIFSIHKVWLWASSCLQSV